MMRTLKSELTLAKTDCVKSGVSWACVSIGISVSMLWNCSLQDAHQGEGAYCGIDQACQRGQDGGDLIKKDTLL